jgi:SAM-dependent methyltransferase
MQNVVTPHVYGGKQGQAFFRCSACDVVHLYPRLTPEEESRFYAAEFSSFMSSRSGSIGGWEQPERHILANQATQARRMKYLHPYVFRPGKILEIGCSSGFMLYPLVEIGHSCVGIEPSGVFADYVRSRNIECFDNLDNLVQSNSYHSSFDLIMHFFVLEHISYPEDFLRKQLQLLKPGGTVVFEIPNVADPLVTIYDLPEFERFYWSVAHPWYFSETSIEFLLKSLSCDFEIKREQRYDLSNHMIWARDRKPGGMGRFTSIWGETVENLYKQSLIDTGLCDTLVGIIRKSS